MDYNASLIWRTLLFIFMLILNILWKIPDKYTVAADDFKNGHQFNPVIPIEYQNKTNPKRDSISFSSGFLDPGFSPWGHDVENDRFQPEDPSVEYRESWSGRQTDSDTGIGSWSERVQAQHTMQDSTESKRYISSLSPEPWTQKTLKP
jgi:hypothetical protein